MKQIEVNGKTYILNNRRDTLDQRDKLFSLVLEQLDLPSKVDLSVNYPKCDDQSNYGSCTSFMGEFLFRNAHGLEHNTIFSHLFLYYNTRLLEHTTRYDSGAYPRDVLKTLSKQGICPEIHWEYSKPLTKKPTKNCYTEALNYKTLVYESIDNRNINAIKSAIAQGLPVGFGATLYDSFNQCYKYPFIAPVPNISESVLGGHAINICGYDNSTRLFKVRNSWSPDWADNGYFYIPYDYITNPKLCSDFWIVRKAE